MKQITLWSIMKQKILTKLLKIPMNENARSLNIASSVAIVLAESLRQTELI